MQEKYMEIAMEEAEKAYKKNEVPVGCVIVKNNKILAKTHNLKENKHSALYHAELIAIKKVSKKLKNWRLIDCEMYITMQPCPMCASAIKQSRIKKIYYGTDNKNNNISNEILNENDINEKIEIIPYILEDKCKEIVRNIFHLKDISKDEEIFLEKQSGISVVEWKRIVEEFNYGVKKNEEELFQEYAMDANCMPFAP